MIKIIQTKFCPICKTHFDRKPGKSNTAWEEQVCCGRDCANINKRKDDNKLIRKARRKDLTPGKNRYQGWGKRRCNNE